MNTVKKNTLKHFNSKASEAIRLTQDEIYEVIQRKIDDYYKEEVFRGRKSNEPLVYERTYTFLNSLIKTDISVNNNTISCSVEIDENFLKYKYPGSNSSGGFQATGLDVVNWANEELHGGNVEGNIKIWKDAISELGGEAGIKKRLEKNLRKVL